MKRIILFDGECLLCNRSVQYIIKRDPHMKFKFALIKSDIGKSLIEEYQIPEAIDSVILIEGESYYIKSTAVLNICREINIRFVSIFSIVPFKFRDYLYDIVARNRTRLFGTSKHCMLLSKDRFL